MDILPPKFSFVQYVSIEIPRKLVNICFIQNSKNNIYPLEFCE